jgi:hypothetical protein
LIEFAGIALLLLLWRGRRAQRKVATIEQPEPPALPWEPPAPIIAEIPQPTVPVTATAPSTAKRRYLLGSADAGTARIERAINGPGLCSPRR